MIHKKYVGGMSCVFTTQISTKNNKNLLKRISSMGIPFSCSLNQQYRIRKNSDFLIKKSEKSLLEWIDKPCNDNLMRLNRNTMGSFGTCLVLDNKINLYSFCKSVQPDQTDLVLQINLAFLEGNNKHYTIFALKRRKRGLNVINHYSL